MKKIVILACILSIFLSGCGTSLKEPYQYTDYTLFDTATTILGYGEDRETFEVQAKEICRELETYHKLFDIYETYDGIQNLKTVNDQAGIAPVRVEQPILDLLQDCRESWVLTDGKVNAGMGSLLSLWHEARSLALAHPEKAKIPEKAERLLSKEHCDLDNMVLDFQDQTVFLRDPDMRLDVGAAAKGWAAEQVSRNAPAGMLISVGGNVCATGPKPDGSPWIVGIQDPDGEGYLGTVPLTKGSLVTSGDYQRYFMAGGKRYHHIIDPDTTMPAEKWRSVTVFCQDSGLGDVLSTALFLLPRDQGQKLLDETGAEAMWYAADGTVLLSPGFPE